MFPHSSFGGASYLPNSVKIIRMILMGCTNRPFYHIVVMEKSKRSKNDPVIEQVGTFDPLPNNNNEKLVAFNFKRLEHWLVEGAEVTPPVRKLLGLAGYFPVHPNSFMDAWNNKKKIAKRIEDLKSAIEKLEKESSSN